jgi:hypothetical protein
LNALKGGVAGELLMDLLLESLVVDYWLLAGGGTLLAHWVP